MTATEGPYVVRVVRHEEKLSAHGYTVPVVVSVKAFETLDEMRAFVFDRSFLPSLQAAAEGTIDNYGELREQYELIRRGQPATLGPLPDGREIEVELTTWPKLLADRATLELIVIEALAHAESLDHELLWNGYAHQYSGKAVSFALQQLKKAGIVHAPSQRGWWELNVVGAITYANERFAAQEGR